MPDVTAIAMSENQPKAGPALSATSDAPVIDITKNTADEAQAAADAEAAAKANEHVGEDTGTAEDGGETETKTRNDKRVPVGEVTKARAKAREAEERALAAETERTALAKSLEALTTKKPEVPADKPQRSAFDDPDAYDAALEGWTDAQIEKARVDAVAKDRAEQQQQSAKAQQERMAESYRNNVETFKADHADFDEVFTDALPISPNMAFAIAESDKAADLSYWLGKNPDECARIYALPPIKQIYELGKIETRLSQAPAAATPKPKPTPIKPLGQRSGTTDKDPAEMSTEEYAAHRNAQLRAV